MKKYRIQCDYYPPYNLDNNYHIYMCSTMVGGIPYWQKIFTGNIEECAKRLKELKKGGK